MLSFILINLSIFSSENPHTPVLVLNYDVLGNLFVVLVKLNGIYDILCSLAILDIIPYLVSPQNPRRSIGSLLITRLSQLHTSMFFQIPSKVPCSCILPDHEHALQRFFAYWIFTYGIIRLCSNDSRLIAYSYYVEALVITNECFIQKTMHVNKSVFVIVISILLGYIQQYPNVV